MIPVFSRRWLRFSLRALLAVMTLLCLWLGWETSIVRERQRLQAKGREGTAVQFFQKSFTPWANRGKGGDPQVPIWRRWLGDRHIYFIFADGSHPEFPQWDLDRLKQLFPEATVVTWQSADDAAASPVIRAVSESELQP
jgi:hypothetical protein